MKRFFPLLSLMVTLCASPGLLAQVELSCEVQHNKYILFEPILVKLTVRNTGPRPIALHEHGKTTARLSFEIKNSRGYPQDRTTQALLKEPVIVGSNEAEVIYTYINTAYLMNKVDSYRISAGVRMGNTQYTSPRQFFDVYQGVEVQKLTTLEPHRVWTLRKLSRSNVGIFLFLRVDDGNGRINYGVHTLDRMIDGFDPQMIIDIRNRIHVLHRRSPKLFMHHVYTPDGQFVERNLYALGFGQVGFRQDERGNIEVAGLVKLKP